MRQLLCRARTDREEAGADPERVEVLDELFLVRIDDRARLSPACIRADINSGRVVGFKIYSRAGARPFPSQSSHVTMWMPFSSLIIPVPMQLWQIGCSKSSISSAGSKASGPAEGGGRLIQPVVAHDGAGIYVGPSYTRSNRERA
jgi:hypothetical protein